MNIDSWMIITGLMVAIYLLKLEHGKYYVGKSNDVGVRINSHMSEGGSSWTKKYKPIDVVEIIEDCDDYDEDKHTIKFMEKYGIENVRGGSFCQIYLTWHEKKLLNRMINGANNRCFICGEKDHFANMCNKNSYSEKRKKYRNGYERFSDSSPECCIIL